MKQGKLCNSGVEVHKGNHSMKTSEEVFRVYGLRQQLEVKKFMKVIVV